MREDPHLDLECVAQLAAKQAFVIASGGCTVAALAGLSSLANIVVVDPNQAQIALTRLKIRLLGWEPEDRLRVIGQRPYASPQRQAALAALLDAEGLAADSLGNPIECAREGPDYYGRYEWLFARLSEKLREQGELVRQTLNGKRAGDKDLAHALRPAFDETFDIRLLQRLFSPQATQNAAMPFAQHFLAQTSLALQLANASSNRFLWSMLAPGDPCPEPPLWTRAPERRPSCAFEIVPASAGQVLADRREQFDFIHLSNILDWLSEDQARATLALARGALRVGGLILIRQLNSTLEIPALSAGFQWRTLEGAELVRRDQSFFYRALHYGTKR